MHLVSPTPFKPGDTLVIRAAARPLDDDGFEPHGLYPHDGETCEVLERNANGNYTVKLGSGTVIPSVPHDALEVKPVTVTAEGKSF
jgi:hypothetical protein